MKTPSEIDLLSSKLDVTPFIAQVIAAADGERNSFGFLPNRAYEDFAVQQRLIVAADRKTGELAGYIIFGGTPPQARIFQTYVAPHYRRYGVGKTMIEEVVRRSESISFLSIRVEVASDLQDANTFYRNQNFKSVREKVGGKTRKRVLITRVRELATPSLLDFADYTEPDGPVINLTLSTLTKPSLYLIDLNVLFDITRRRNNSLGAGRVLAAALDNSVALAVASEFINELERNGRGDKADPILEIAKALPRLKSPPGPICKTYRETFAPLLFPDRWFSNRLSVQDESDIVHLATAVEEGADGFITSEKAILACADWFRSTHQLDVLSPDVFGKHYTSTARTSSGYQILLDGKSVSARDLSSADLSAVKDFLALQEVPDRVLKNAILSGTSTSPRRRLVVSTEDGIVAFGSWASPTVNNRVLRVYLFANETHAACDLAVDYLLENAARDASADGPAVLQINPATDRTLIRSRAINHGFRARAGSSVRTGKLEKLCLGSVITEQNWTSVRTRVRDLVGIDLPDAPPVFRNANDHIVLRSIGGAQATTPLGAFEDFASPAIFAMRGRPASIVPIRPDYVEALFRGSRQPSFLNDEQAALLRRRRYFGSARTYSMIPERGLIFFYESSHKGHGRSAAIAVARIVRRYLAEEDVAKSLSVERGVLSSDELMGIAKGKEVCVTEFDNLMMFERAVSLDTLKTIGCADASNMVTARSLGSDAVLALIQAGQPKCIQ